MLVPAILHKEQIKKEFQKYFYTTDMLYETGGMCNWSPNIEECPDESQFQYAIVDKNEKLIGYLGYSVDWYVSKAYNFGLFSFDRGNVLVGKDVYFGEILGKHSEVYGTIEEGEITLESDDPLVVKNAVESGYNPLDYLEEDEDE